MKKTIEEKLPSGRYMQKVVGKVEDGYKSNSKILNIGYCRYCVEAGLMKPHMHDEETVQILSAVRAWVRYGTEKQPCA